VSELAVGDKAPAFKLLRDGGGMVSLTDFRGKKLVLFFYPRADTPGCTRESIDFSRLRDEFTKAGAEILGVSGDSVPAQDAFRDKHALTVALGSDPTHAMLEAYGVWGKKSMYGKIFMGVLRATFLIGPDARIVRIWPKVKVPGHAEDVLKAVHGLDAPPGDADRRPRRLQRSPALRKLGEN
jgi:peroxiredoxin Q/BCP